MTLAHSNSAAGSVAGRQLRRGAAFPRTAQRRKTPRAHERAIAAAAPALERADFVQAMASAVNGVSVVTTDGTAGRFGITVSSVASVSADPPMVLVCLNRRSPASAALRENEAFCVNLLSKGQRAVAETFAGRPAQGEPFDFASASWSSSVTRAPCFDDAVAIFDCVLEKTYDAGSHTIFLGRVVFAKAHGGEPLLYTHRQYGYPSRWS